MAIRVRIVMTMMIVVVMRLVVTAMIVTALMVVMIVAMAKVFVSMLCVGLAGLDMDVGNVVSRVAMPHRGGEPRYRSCVEQERIRAIESAEGSLPTNDLLLEPFHLRLRNACKMGIRDATDSPEPVKPG